MQDILVPIWAERKRILLISFVVALIVLGVNFLLPVYYRSTAVLLPETEGGKLGAMGQFAGVAALAGIDISGGDISRLYPVISQRAASNSSRTCRYPSACSSGAKGCRLENSGHVIGIISVAALSFIVHEPSGIIDVSKPMSFRSSDFRYRIISVSEW